MSDSRNNGAVITKEFPPFGIPSQVSQASLAIIIPAFNEERNLSLLYAELRGVLGTLHRQVQVIIVDDGSSDGTWATIQRLSQTGDLGVRGIRLRRNCGKTAALRAGFQACTANWVVTLDADLQDDPSEIPRLLSLVQEGFDLVVGWKRCRNDPWHKVLASRLFNLAIRRATGLRIHDNNCGLKCFRKSVLDELPLFGDLHRFSAVLAHGRGFRVGEVEVNHRPRLYGKSKYGFRRLWTGLSDLLAVRFMLSFSERPFQCIGGIGMAAMGGGLVGIAYLVGLWLTTDQPIGTRPLLAFSIASLLFGMQVIMLGILAELVIWRVGGKVTDSPIADSTVHDTNWKPRERDYCCATTKDDELR